MLTDFQNSFTDRLNRKFATKSYLNIPPHFKYVATLPRKIIGVPKMTVLQKKLKHYTLLCKT